LLNRNTGRGVLLLLIALLFLIQAPRYAIGSFSSPGSGLFPLIVASLLFVMGAAIVFRSYFTQPVPVDVRFRSIALISTALVGFALLSEYVNMLLGIAFMTTVACRAGEDVSIRRTLVIGVTLCLIAFAMKWLLAVPLPLY
jgi:hypothetical protein